MSNAEKTSAARKVNVKRRDIDLLRALRYSEGEKVKEKKRGRPGAIIYIIGAALVLAAAGVYAVTSLQCSLLETENDDLLADISLAQIEVSRAEQMELKLDWLKKLDADTAAQLSELENADAQYDYLTRDLFSRIRRQLGNGTSIKSIEIEDGLVTLGMAADSQSKAAELVQRLRAEGIFTQIIYSGFTASEGESETVFSISCSLSDDFTVQEGTE